MESQLVDQATPTPQHAARLHATLSVSGNLTLTNAAWQIVLGWSPTDIEGTPFIERVHPDDRDRVIMSIHTLYAGGTPDRFQCRYAHKDGGYVAMAWEATPRLDLLEVRLDGRPLADS